MPGAKKQDPGGQLAAAPASPADMQTQVNGLMGEILMFERLETEANAKAKEMADFGDQARAKLKLKLLAAGITTVKHESGYSVQIAKQKVFSLPTEENILAGLKKLNWLPLYTQVIPEQTIPAHTEVDTKKLIADLKKNPAAIPYFEGVEVRDTDTLKIVKPKK